MYAVIRKFPGMKNLEEATRRAETGLGPIAEAATRVQGLLHPQTQGGGGGSISLFESADAAKAAHQRALSWLKENMADLTGGGEPDVTMGEVVAQVTA